jgi:hypothetical protein
MLDVDLLWVADGSQVEPGIPINKLPLIKGEGRELGMRQV